MKTLIKTIVRSILWPIAIILGLVVGLIVANQIRLAIFQEPKIVMVEYPEFTPIIEKEKTYCEGISEIVLSRNWEKMCVDYKKDKHCSLTEYDAKRQFEAQARVIEGCENRIK